MRRRDLFKVIAGSAAAWSFAAQAQQPAVPVLGSLTTLLWKQAISAALDEFAR